MHAARCFIGEMAYGCHSLCTSSYTPILLFQQKRQVLEPIKVSHSYLKAQGSFIKVYNFVNALLPVLLLNSLATSL
jgi:hypothetical protein